MSLKNNFTVLHEKLNAWSHGLAGVAMLVFSYFLIGKYFHDKHFSAVLLFCFSSCFMFFASSAYHFALDFDLKQKVRIFDHISIFWAIGSTTLPFVLKFGPEKFSTFFIYAQWGLIILGSILKIFFAGKFRLFSSIIYIIIGALVLILGADFWNALPSTILNYIIVGGVLYFVGVIFYQNRKIPYNHFIWHLFVVVALFYHALAIWNIKP
jgi:hemolysin III